MGACLYSQIDIKTTSILVPVGSFAIEHSESVMHVSIFMPLDAIS